MTFSGEARRRLVKILDERRTLRERDRGNSEGRLCGGLHRLRLELRQIIDCALGVGSGLKIARLSFLRTGPAAAPFF
jgi:hypothetical protein